MTAKSAPTNQRKPLHVFVDASNLWEAQKSMGRFFDYRKLVQYIRSQFGVARLEVFYYTAYPKAGTRSYSLAARHQFYVFLSKGLGFHVRKKPLKQIKVKTGSGYAVQEKGNMDVEITIDAIDRLDNYDQAVFFTGDSDFLALIRYLRSKGKKSFVVSSRRSVARELRTGADGYIDITQVHSVWGKPLQHRSKK